MNLLNIKPDESLIIGVQPKTNHWGDPMSQEVSEAIDKVVDEVKEQIKKWRESAS
jgi:Ni,Fe-hydrogenase maturation factor